MKTIENVAAFFFMVAVAILSGVAILGVWDLFEKDVIGKSFQTLGLLAVIAIIVMVAGKYFDSRSQTDLSVPAVPSPVFKTVRKITVTVLIISASILAILGVLAIWDVITDKDVLYKSMSSVAILAFGAFIIVMTALDREGNSFMNRGGKKMSVGTIVLVLVLGWILFSFFGMFRYY